MEHELFVNAELVRRVAREKLGVVVQYDAGGVQWLDAYINSQRQQADEETKGRLPSTLGSFVGECIRHSYGGQWVQDPEHGWMVRINEKLSVYPFNKVRKQLTNEDGDSVLGLFTAIPALLREVQTSEPEAKAVSEVSRRPWWKFW